MIGLLNDLLSFMTDLLSLIGPIVLLLFFVTVTMIDEMKLFFDDTDYDS